MPADSFFARRARNLMRRPRSVKLDALVLESRVVPAITGNVFQDYNANGQFDTTATLPNAGANGGSIATAIDIGVGGITVTAFDAAGGKLTTATAPNGSYSLATGAGSYRIEFTGLPAGVFSGPHGTTSRTAVQFAANGSTNVNFGVVRPADYYKANPQLVTNEYIVGDATGNLDNVPANNPIFGASRPGDATIVGFDYNAGTSNQNAPNGEAQAGLNPSIAIPARQVGTTWGLGYDRTRNATFAASFTKRHAGYGPGGPGAIYTFPGATPTNPTVTAASVWLDLGAANALGTFAGFRSGYTKNDDYVADSGDTGWNAAGKTALGGLDVNDTGTQLYVMNLATRSLVVVAINADGTPGARQSFIVPTPAGVAASDVRPFAVQFYRGLVYIGLVNSAESSQDRTALRGYVYAFNPANSSYSASLVNEGATAGFSLSYEKGLSYGGLDRYNAWAPTFRRVNVNGGPGLAGALDPNSNGNPSKYPQPELSGLAFDAAGNLTIGVRDRNGDQTGRYIPSQGGTGGLEGLSSGDILKAFRNDLGNLGSGWSLEANAASPVAGNPGVGTGPNNGQGPLSGANGGEFFAMDGYTGANTNDPGSLDGSSDGGHRDVAVGGLAQLPGFPSVLTTAFDPLRQREVRSGGVRWFNSTTGLLEKSYLVYPTDASGNTFGKASGLGDLIAIQDEPPVEIGNRIFRDDNRNGVQDANEDGIGGVTVQLWWAGPDNVFGTGDDIQIGPSVVTDNTAAAGSATRGSFYFNNGPAPGAVGPNEAYGINKLTRTQIVGGAVVASNYQIRIPNATGGSQQAPLLSLAPTGFQTDATANGTSRDSDAKSVGTTGVIGTFTLGAIGENNHTLDAGFAQALFLGDVVWNDLDNSGTRDAGEPGIDGIIVNLYDAANAAKVIATTNTSGGGQYLFGGLTPGQYVVEIVAPPGFRSSTGGGSDTINGPTESGLAGNPLTNNTDHGKASSGSITAGFAIRTNTVTLFDPSGANKTGNPSQVNLANDANLFQDFGIFRTFALGNRVWQDKNNNGMIDAADGAAPGIDGAAVRLYRPTDFDAAGNLNGNAATVRTTTTANGGYYRFDDLLSGTYVAVVDGASAPLAGLRSSTGGAAGTTTFEPAPGTLGTVSVADSDDNGTTISGSLVRSGSVTLGPAPTPLGETDLVAGANPQGNIDAQADMTLDFGFYRPLSLGNLVFDDANNNGTFDAGENGIGGVTVRVFRGNAAGVPQGAALATQTTTTSAGFYLFTGLGADTYVVEVDGKTLPGGRVWFSSSGTNGSLTGPYEPAANPDTNPADSDDNGSVFQNDAAAYLIRSGAVSLSGGTEPVGEPATPGFTDLTPDADSNLTADFGFWQPLSIGNFVFNDVNNSGSFDATEKGFADVPVTLYADDGDGAFNPAVDKVVATQKTSNVAGQEGFYLFTNLAAGNYFVAITTPTGFTSSSGNGSEPASLTAPDNADHGTNAGALIRSNLITLAAGTAPTGEPATPGRPDVALDANANYAIDFGLFQSLRIGDFVFEDANNNGTFDAGDKGLDGVLVTLLDGTGKQLGTTTTANGGAYLFTSLTPGQYQVQITPPANYTSSTGGRAGGFEPGVTANTENADHGTQFGSVVKAAVITLGNPGDTAANPSDGGFANLAQDFGLFRPVAVGNFVWEDRNNNGTFDAGELPLVGVTVALLDGTNAVVATQQTNAVGEYLFTGLTAGTYTLRATTPAGYATSTGKNGSVTGPFEPGISANTNNADHGTASGGFAVSTVTLAAGGDAANPSTVNFANDANLTQDFGFYRPLALGDLVFNDANNSGKLDGAERGIVGVAVTLIDANGNTVATTTTDGSGNYLFANLVPGSYTVRIAPPAGFTSSTGTPSSASGPYEPGVNGNQNSEDHGTTTAGGIVANVTLGNPGDTNANPDNGGLANLRQDFGLLQTLSLGNFVFRDANNNGVLDTGEAGIAGVRVELLNAAGAVVGTQSTDGNGNYLFTGLTPATYTIRVTTPLGLASSSGTPNSLSGPFEPGVSGTQDNQDHGTASGNFATSTATLAAGGSAANPDNGGFANLRQDFGFAPAPVTTLSLGNFVFNDANNNGKFDAGEAPIAGATLTLRNAAGAVVGTQTTDGNGNYLFIGLTPGTYTVVLTPPTAFLRTSTGTVGSASGPYEPGVSGTQDSEDHGSAANGTIAATVTLAAFGNAANPDSAGAANFRQDFGVFTPLSYGNTVFFDSNNNGILDAGERTSPGVPVRLFDGAGKVVATATTGTDGKYFFDNLVPGTYRVEITPPAGLSASTPVFDPLNALDNRNIGTQSGAVISSQPFALALGKAPLISGNTNPNNFLTGDFGLQGLAMVSGFTYLDPNIDGIFTPGVNGDRPLGGTTVTLTGTDVNGAAVTRTTRTDGTGFYKFDSLVPGTYTIRETQPGGILFDGLDTVGSLGGTSPLKNSLTVTLRANDNGLNYNFGEIPPATPYGYVWVDLNRNCTFDPGEPALAGVPVTISGTAFAGSVLSRPLTSADAPGGLTVLTSATGRYEFPLLPPGTYTISRGSLTPAQALLYSDFCLQNGDPKGPPPGSGRNTFTDVFLAPSAVRGPFSFGVVPVGTSSTTNDPSKQDFLGSTNGVGGTPGIIPAPGPATRADVPFSPSFNTTTGGTVPALVVTAAGAGYAPQVRVFDYASGVEKFKFYAYEESFTGGVRAATGDVTGDGTPDVITATGVGGGPRIRVFDGNTGAVVRDVFAYESSFRGGVFVAAGDVTGDGVADIVTGTDTGGGPRVTVFNGATGAVVYDFFAFEQTQRGGVRVAVADFNGDGRADIVTTTGPGVSTRVRVYSGRDLSVLADYAPYEASFTGGVNLAAGDFNGDGTADIIVGAEAGGGPRVQVFSGLTQTVLANYFAYESTFTGGVRVSAKDVNGDGKVDIVQAAGPGGSSRIRVLRSTDLAPLDDFYAFDPDFTGGTYVG